MTNSILTTQEQTDLQKISSATDTNGQRAAALIALNNGLSQSKAAEESGLTLGQVKYALRKFRKHGVAAFMEAGESEETAVSPPPPPPPTEKPSAPPPSEKPSRMAQLIKELDELTSELKSAIPDPKQPSYSPLKLLSLIRENASKFSPTMQSDILEQFKGMSHEDLLDIDTWKGLAYMLGYSAQFQAEQAREKLNEQLPDPIKPDTLIGMIQKNLNRVTPDIAKQLADVLKDASAEDLRDPETWKGMAYMLSYSAQFQASQVKEKLNEELPETLRPDTWINLFKQGFDKFAPDIAKQLVEMFEDATLEDLKDIDTWKGVWYMLSYSIQFQIDEFRQRVTGEEADE